MKKQRVHLPPEINPSQIPKWLGNSSHANLPPRPPATPYNAFTKSNDPTLYRRYTRHSHQRNFPLKHHGLSPSPPLSSSDRLRPPLPLLWPCLDALALFRSQISPKFYYAKRRFHITSKYRHMHGVLNVDEIKN
jgi:hypothetical protein